jgi:hypothetical protein
MHANRGRSLDTEQIGLQCAVLSIVFFAAGVLAHSLRPIGRWQGFHLEVLLPLAASVAVSVMLAVHHGGFRKGVVVFAVLQAQVVMILVCFVLGWQLTDEGNDPEFLRICSWFWLADAVTAGAVLISKRVVVRWKQPDPAGCPGCGYSLVGLPTARCPECGRAFTADELDVDPAALEVAPPIVANRGDLSR